MDSRPRADAVILQRKPRSMPRTDDALINQLVLRKRRAKFGASLWHCRQRVAAKDEQDDEFATSPPRVGFSFSSPQPGSHWHQWFWKHVTVRTINTDAVLVNHLSAELGRDRHDHLTQSSGYQSDDARSLRSKDEGSDEQ
jgi:hypothetical protein